MHLSTGRARLLLAAAAATALVAGCSSSNNKNNNAPNTAKTITSVSTPLTAARTPTPAPTVLRTPTPAPTVVRTPTPAAGGASTARTATPSSAAATTSGSGGADATLNQALAAAALKSSDLPGGYIAAGAPETSLTLPGQTAGYQMAYGSISGSGISVIVDGLLGFKDVPTAQNLFKDAQSQLQSANSDSGLKLATVSSTAKIGDETQVFSASLTASGTPLSGYAVLWRQGRLGGTIVVAGTAGAAPTTPDSAIALAQKQAANLQNVKQ